MKVTVIGSINIDLVYDVPHIVSPGETLHSSNYGTFFGGKGANQATTISQLGAEVNFVGCVGEDDFGTNAIENLMDYSVSTNYIKQSGTTGNALIQVSDSGENAIVLMKGANYEVTPALVKEASKLIAYSDAIVMQLEIPLESVVTGLELANQYEVPVILNPAPGLKLSNSILSMVDILTPNETELAILTDRKIESDQDVEDACTQILNQGVKVVIVTLGERGAYYTNGDESGWISANKVEVVDTTGAGDAFIGALTVGICQKYNLREAIKYANRVAGHIVTQKGAQVKMPNDLLIGK